MMSLILALLFQIATPNLSGLSAASVVSVKNDNNNVHITVSVTDMNGNTKQWSEYILGAEQTLWMTDQKAVIVLAYEKAAKSLSDDVVDRNRPIPTSVVTAAVSLVDATAYLSTAQAELAAVPNK